MIMHHMQSVLLLLLVVVVAFTMVAERLQLPYAIVLLLAGLILSFVPHMPQVPLEPNVVFLLFLPPLLFRAAWLTSWRELRRNLVSISMLAIGLVAFTALGIAEFADHFITALDWRSGFLLGAVVSTTDAVAASAIAKRIGLPKAIVDMLEGESLVNDATGLLALQFGIALVVEGRVPTLVIGAGTLLWLITGGIGMGLVVGCTVVWLEHHIEDGPVKIVLSILAAYASYLVGERVHSSGVLAVVACGLFVSRRSKHVFSPSARLQADNVWEALDFAMNGIIFCLIGLQIPYVLVGIREYSWETLLLYGAVFSLVLIGLRLLWVFPGAWFGWWVRVRVLKQRYPQPEARSVFIVGWTGMRGVIALAAAISLPEKLSEGRLFAQRDLIIFLTFCVILVTLIGQGLTLPALVRTLKITGRDDIAAEEIIARHSSIDAAVQYLKGCDNLSPLEQRVIDDLLRQYQHRRNAASSDVLQGERALHETMFNLMKGAAKAERHVLLSLWTDEIIGDETMRQIEHELDLFESRLLSAR